MKKKKLENTKMRKCSKPKTVKTVKRQKCENGQKVKM